MNLNSYLENARIRLSAEGRESTRSQVLFVLVLTLIFGLTLAVGLGQAQDIPAAGAALPLDNDWKVLARNQPGSGLAKAAAYAECGRAATVHSSFNNVGDAVDISGGLAGGCTLDFGFRVDDRFFLATAVDTRPNAQGVTCSWGSDETKLDCQRWNATGNGADGPIMVVIY